jgi:ADP-heptose:LPS heptosyltransferase
MRAIDRWLGTPVCWALTLWRRLFGLRTPALSFQPQRVLFVKLAEQGSTVLAYPVLAEAARRFGRENVYFLLFDENRPVLDFLDVLPQQNVIAIRAKGLLRTVFSALSAVWTLRRRAIDVAIDLEFFARSSAALTYLSGAQWRVGYHSFHGEASYRGDLMTHRLSFNPYLHTSQTFALMLDAIRYPAATLPTIPEPAATDFPELPQFQPTDAEVAEVRAVLQTALGQWADAPLILLNANASDLMPLRRWDPSNYVELAGRLLEQFPEAVIGFTGAPSESPAVERLVQQINSPRCVNLAGRTSFRQLIVLYGLAEVLVTNDSGPAHFATLTPVDVVVLFGPETPRLFAAQSPRTHVLWAGLACSPCINAFNNRNSACQDNVCMQQIGVDDVLERVTREYQSRRNQDRRAA